MKKEKKLNLEYLLTNDRDEEWGAYATSIGFQSIKPNESYPPKVHPSKYWFSPHSGRVLSDYHVIYVASGEGYFESSSCKKQKVLAGSAILLFPGEWHTYSPLKDVGWEEYWMGFNGKTIKNLVAANFFSPQHPVINIGYSEQIMSFFDTGMEIAHQRQTAYQQVLGSIAGLLLGFIFYYEKNNFFSDKLILQQIKKATQLMNDTANNEYALEDIAAELNMSYSWFRRLFKQYTGFSPGKYQLEIKMQKAKELLAGSNMAIKEICYKLDFDSMSHFGALFKSKCGLSPSKYREKARCRF